MCVHVCVCVWHMSYYASELTEYQFCDRLCAAFEALSCFIISSGRGENCSLNQSKVPYSEKCSGNIGVGFLPFYNKHNRCSFLVVFVYFCSKVRWVGKRLAGAWVSHFLPRFSTWGNPWRNGRISLISGISLGLKKIPLPLCSLRPGVGVFFVLQCVELRKSGTGGSNPVPPSSPTCGSRSVTLKKNV